MEYKFKKSIAFILLLCFFTSATYFPILLPEKAIRKAEAGGLPVWDIPSWVQKTLDIVGRAIAQKMVNDIVRSTVTWANSGFDGNPAYPNDWGRYIENTAKGAAGEYIRNDSKLGFLCEPFQAQIKLSLVQQTVPQESQFECSLDKIGVNYENFVNNFQEGGWDAFFEATQSESGNPLSAYVTAKIDLDDRVANQLGIVNEERRLNSGFLSYQDCEVINTPPPTSVRSDWLLGNTETKRRIETQYPNWNPSVMDGECIKKGPVKTPGSIIETQLNKSLSSGLDSLIKAEHIDSLVSAFLSGLLTRYVFGPKGTFSDDSSSAGSEEVIDVDRDNIPDGYDYDGDLELDICHHGVKNSEDPPSNNNCLGSAEVENSPFFIPICSATATTLRALTSYKTFINQYDFNKINANTWMNRTINAQSAVDNLISTISRYEMMEYDQALFSLGGYSGYLDDRVESLAKDGDLRGSFQFDSWELSLLRRNTDNIFAYLQKFNAAIGQCDNPDTDAINSIEPPDIDDENTTGTSTPPTTTSTDPLSCVPSKEVARPNQSIVWSMQSRYNNATGFLWEGDGINVASTTRPENLFISYSETGTKSATITAFFATSSPITAECNTSVIVTNSFVE